MLSIEVEFLQIDDLLQARDEVLRYIEGFYNPRRLHSSIDSQPPDQFRATIL